MLTPPADPRLRDHRRGRARVRAGFTVLTGETGAGKSILVDALGSRARRPRRRRRGARAPSAPRSAPSSTSLGIARRSHVARRAVDSTHDDELHAAPRHRERRPLRAYINGQPCTLTQLRRLGELLVDIHGQHEYQSLMRSARSASCSTACGDSNRSARPGARCARTPGACAQRDRASAQASTDRERELELLPGSRRARGARASARRMARARRRAQRLAHGRSWRRPRGALDASREADASAAPAAGRAAAALPWSGASTRALRPIDARHRARRAQLQEAAQSRCRATSTDWSSIPQRCARSSGASRGMRGTRAQASRRACRRCRQRCRRELRDGLETLRGAGASLELRDAARRCAGAYARARKLSAAGRAAARASSRDAVTQLMQELGMAGGRFEVELAPARRASRDRTAPIASSSSSARTRANRRGRSRKVASGGELSRIAWRSRSLARAADTLAT